MKLAARLALSSFIVLVFVSSDLRAADEHGAIKPVSRAGGWMTRHESMNKRVAQGNVDLVFIGDSITQGWEGNGKEVWAKH